MLGRVMGWLGRVFSGRDVREVSRNAPCPCGSGQKYKRCCLDHDAATLRDQQARSSAAATNYIGGRATVANRALESANKYHRPKVK